MSSAFGRGLFGLASVLLIQLVGAQQQAPIDQAKALEAIRMEIDESRRKLFIPGVSVAIVKDDRVIFMEGLGHRDLKSKKPVTPDTLFAIGSTSKAFTAMLTAMAVDEGKLKFSDSPKRYLPYFRMYDPETDAKMTVGDLLSHRSGLPRTDLIMITGQLSVEDMIWNVTRAKPTAKLGEKWQYQNVMFIAAGEVLKAVYGNPWEDLVRDRIFAPLGMARSNTTVEATQADSDHALGYDGSPEFKRLPMRSLTMAAPAGAINSSARDMSEWVRFLLRGGTVGDKRLISEANFAENFKPHMTVAGPVKYGYGWMIRDWNGHKVVHHGGNIDGFNAEVALMPDQNLGFVILTNVSGSALPATATESIWKHLVGAPANAAKIVALTDPEKEVGTYHLALANLDFVVTHEGGKLFVKPTGQPKMELLPLGDRRYKIAPPAPDQVFLSFSPEKEDPKRTQAQLEQGGMKHELKQAKPYEAPIGVEELMSKAIQALGGEANLRQVKSLSYRFVYDMESQGLKAAGITAKVAPGTQGDLLIFTAGGRRIGWDYSACDGVSAAEEASFGPTDWKRGTELADSIIGCLTFQELDWQKHFPSVTIIGTDKVDGQEVFVVEKRPKRGSPVKDYISATSYLLLKRTYGAGPGQVTETYKEYRPYAGIQIPVVTLRETAITGKGVVTITDVQVNGPIPRTLVSLPRR